MFARSSDIIRYNCNSLSSMTCTLDVSIITSARGVMNTVWKLLSICWSSCSFCSSNFLFSYLRRQRHCASGTRQGDHLSGKPGNVREFDSCQGNVRDFTKKGKILSGKNCLKLFIVNCIFESIQVFSISISVK